MPLRALLFDLDHTLIDRARAHAAWVREVAPESAWPALIERDEWGYRERADYFAWVARAYPDLGNADALWDRYRARLPELIEPRPRVNALLARLAGRLELGLVSNGGRRTQRRKLARAGLSGFFPQPVISAELGATKPDPAPFAAGLQRLGVTPEEALFVGDDPQRDVCGARAAGLNTCWVSHGRAWPSALPPPDHTVVDVLELEAVL